MSEEQTGNRVNPIESALRLQSIQQGQICRFSSSRIDNPSEYRIHSYGDFSPLVNFEPTAEDYFLPDLLGGSDYSGCSVHRSNYRVFLRLFAETVGVHDLYGGHGTFAVAIRLDVENPELWEKLDGLAEYPAIDDGDVSLLEIEEQKEAWDSWAESDYRNAVEEWHGCRTFQIDSERLSEVFHKVAESNGEYWADQDSGGGPWIDISKIVELTEWETLREHGAQLPEDFEEPEPEGEGEK
jgi:hypothetical protein